MKIDLDPPVKTASIDDILMSDSTLAPRLAGLLADLCSEVEEDKKEIDLRRKRVIKNEALIDALKGRLNASRGDSEQIGGGSRTATIRLATARISKARFTQEDIENEMKGLNPTLPVDRDKTRAAIWNMVDRKELKCVRKGSKFQQAEYERGEAMIRFKRSGNAASNDGGNQLVGLLDTAS